MSGAAARKRDAGRKIGLGVVVARIRSAASSFPGCKEYRQEMRRPVCVARAYTHVDVETFKSMYDSLRTLEESSLSP